MSEESASPATAAPASHLTDFPDRLSPMLVKELRQGMRTNLFTVAFILLQAFMVLCVLLGSMASGDSGAVSGFFWFFVIVTLLVAMPIRGFSALTSEINLNTMDLIQLTQLGAWRITFGKWAALVSQSLLLVCGILPYLVMRYFFGGIDLFNELWKLFAIVLGSMLLTAVTVGFSAFRSVLLRTAVIVGLTIVSFNLSMLTMISGATMRGTGIGGVFGMSSIYTPDFWWGVAGLIAACTYAIFFLLDLGASRIAPDAENHATRKRLGALGFVLVIMQLPYVGVDYQFCAVLSGIVIGVVGIDAITERASLVPSIFRPFVVTRPWTRLFAPFLTPGWHTGVRFFLVIYALWIGFIYIHNPGDFQDEDFVLMLVSLGGAILFPLLIIHLFMKNIADTPAAFSIYILIQCCTALIGLFLMAVGEAIGDVAFLIFPIPMVTLFAAGENDGNAFLLLCAVALVVITVVIVQWRAMPLGKVTRYIAKQMKETSSAEPS